MEVFEVFQPDSELRERIIDAIARQAAEPATDESGEQRRQYAAQLERLRDLYLMGETSARTSTSCAAKR